MSQSPEEMVHQARMLSFQGKTKEAIDMYQSAVNQLADRVELSPEENKESLQKQIHMYLEEAECMKSAVKAKEESAAPSMQEGTSLPPNPSTAAPHPPADFWTELGKAFNGLGEEMRNIDEKYGISEKAKEVGTKASNIINSPEWELRAAAMNESIRRWDQENHVTENIAAAFRVVADSTQRAFDSLFPSMTVPQSSGTPSSQPVNTPSSQPVNQPVGAPTQPMYPQTSQPVYPQASMQSQPVHYYPYPQPSYTPIQPMPTYPVPSTSQTPSAPSVEANLSPQDESKFSLCCNKHTMSMGEREKRPLIRLESTPSNTRGSTVDVSLTRVIQRPKRRGETQRAPFASQSGCSRQRHMLATEKPGEVSSCGNASP